MMNRVIKSIRESMAAVVMSLPDSAFYQYKYLITHGKACNFDHPQRFSEKIFHRMRHPAALFSRLADKAEVRHYIADLVGPQYVVPAYLVCEHVTADTFTALPDTFVMKANHSFGQLRIVLDKRLEDTTELARVANGWLASGFPSRMREKHYRSISPRILFEHALLTDGKPPADYKFNVFNPGKGQRPFIFIQHMQGRFEYLTQDLYLEDWSVAPFKLRHQKTSGRLAPKPAQLAEMLQVAKKLAEPLGYMRVDFYLHEGRIYVGELTLTPGAGRYVFDPKRMDEELGKRFGWPEAAAPDDGISVSNLPPPVRSVSRVASTLE